MRRATECFIAEDIGHLQFQSTLSVRRATAESGRLRGGLLISIHALREESDAIIVDRHHGRRISIHALREESDADRIELCHLIVISIHALREESDFAQVSGMISSHVISIHALREESDANTARRHASHRYFNPRSP